VFEGPDAAGKGGAIRRITWALDARSYRVIPIAAPSDEERAHHYLWRFWRHLPRRGRLTIFDRSWYGRVLVERVEGLAAEPDWQRAYQEINDFERELTRAGVILIKFWLHISPDEQLRRFEERRKNPAKRYKITAEDYRNREHANQYEAAAAEMIARCSPPEAPFTLVEANDKRFARLKVLETVCRRLGGRP
jgi:polyphosphate kinase 2 (PPK2 family)